MLTTIGIAESLEFWKIDILFSYELQVRVTKPARLNIALKTQSVKYSELLTCSTPTTIS